MIIIIFQIFVAISGLYFFVYGIINDLILGFVIGGILLWITAVPWLITLFKKK